MRLADFDYELPDRLIARHPADERRASRLLVVDVPGNRLIDARFADIADFLARGDLLVLNDTRVIRARLHGSKTSGGRVEILIERVLGETTALAQIRASKAPKADTRLVVGGGCEARILRRRGEMFELEFAHPVHDLMDASGEVPLPPYLGRQAAAADEARYQTVYAREPGAVAAPTAGLHFDQALIDELGASGVGHVFVTLHVGAGTFQSLRHDRVDDNRLHSERVVVGETAAAKMRASRDAGGRIVAVGTTAVRSLESATLDGRISAFAGETDLFIRPGYRFRAVDLLLTNFHLPRSSLLMLVSAFAGRERILDAYRHAVSAEYRFFSYGDAMLIIPGSGT